METMHLLTAHEVADKLGLTVHQVYRRLQRGDIPSTLGGRHGQQYLVDPVALDEYIEAGQPLTTPRRDRTMLGVPEVARLTGFTAETVRKLCYQGTLGFVRGAGKNGHLRIYRSSVTLYLSSNKD